MTVASEGRTTQGRTAQEPWMLRLAAPLKATAASHVEPERRKNRQRSLDGAHDRVPEKAGATASKVPAAGGPSLTIKWGDKVIIRKLISEIPRGPFTGQKRKSPSAEPPEHPADVAGAQAVPEGIKQMKGLLLEFVDSDIFAAPQQRLESHLRQAPQQSTAQPQRKGVAAKAKPSAAASGVEAAPTVQQKPQDSRPAAPMPMGPHAKKQRTDEMPRSAKQEAAAATQPCQSAAAEKAAPAVQKTLGLTSTRSQQQQSSPAEGLQTQKSSPATPGAPVHSSATQKASQIQQQQQSIVSARPQPQAASGAPARSSLAQHAGHEDVESKLQALPHQGVLAAAGPVQEQTVRQAHASAQAAAQGSTEKGAAAAAKQSILPAVPQDKANAGPASQLGGAAHGPMAAVNAASAPVASQAEAAAGPSMQQGAPQGAAAAAAAAAAAPAPAPPPQHHMQWGQAAAARARARKARKAQGLPTEPQPAELTPELRAQYAAMAAKLGIKQSPELEQAAGKADADDAESSPAQPKDTLPAERQQAEAPKQQSAPAQRREGPSAAQLRNPRSVTVQEAVQGLARLAPLKRTESDMDIDVEETPTHGGLLGDTPSPNSTGTAAGASPEAVHAFSVPVKPQSAPAASDETGAAAKDGEGSSPGSSASDNEQVKMSRPNLEEGELAEDVRSAQRDRRRREASDRDRAAAHRSRERSYSFNRDRQYRHSRSPSGSRRLGEDCQRRRSSRSRSRSQWVDRERQYRRSSRSRSRSRWVDREPQYRRRSRTRSPSRCVNRERQYRRSSRSRSRSRYENNSFQYRRSRSRSCRVDRERQYRRSSRSRSRSRCVDRKRQYRRSSRSRSPSTRQQYQRKQEESRYRTDHRSCLQQPAAEDSEELRQKLWQLKARSDLDERYAQTAVAALERRLRRALDTERSARAKHSAERATPCSSPSPRPSRSPLPMKVASRLNASVKPETTAHLSAAAAAAAAADADDEACARAQPSCLEASAPPLPQDDPPPLPDEEC